MKKLFPLLLVLTLMFSTIVYADDNITITPADNSLSNSYSTTLSVPASAPSLKASTYTITFNSNGGSTVATQYVGSGSYVTKPEDPYRLKYQFLGWFTDDNVEYNFSTAVTSSFTLTAHWALKASDDVTITFVSGDANGGVKWSNGSYVKTVTQKEGNKLTSIPKPDFTNTLSFDYYTKTEHTNWTDNTLPKWDESSVIYNDLVLYAVYKEEDNSGKFVKVKFDANEGYFGDKDDDETVRSSKIRKGSTVSKPSDPKRKDYDFKGWYYSEDNSDSDKFDFDDTIDEDLTLYAHWKLDEDAIKDNTVRNYNLYKGSSSMLTPEQLLALQTLQAQQAAATANAKLPKTGVGFSPVLIILLLVIIGIIAVLVYKRQNTKDDNV